jgi:hypothetical protein
MRSRFTIIAKPNTRSTGPRTSQKTFMRNSFPPNGCDYHRWHRENALGRDCPSRPTTLKP